MYLWLNQGNGQFQATTVMNPGTRYDGYKPALGDFNGDGLPDIRRG